MYGVNTPSENDKCKNKMKPLFYLLSTIRSNVKHLRSSICLEFLAKFYFSITTGFQLYL